MRLNQLQPGGLSFTRGATQVETLLGSCVSVTMRHAESGLSAMCHCLLATMPITGTRAREDGRHAYIDLAFADMLTYFRNARILPGQLEVKLFGGAEVLKVLSGPKSVARENVRAAQHLISYHGLRLAASDVGGQVGRKITFMTHTGEVRVRKMNSPLINEPKSVM